MQLSTRQRAIIISHRLPIDAYDWVKKRVGVRLTCNHYQKIISAGSVPSARSAQAVSRPHAGQRSGDLTAPRQHHCVELHGAWLADSRYLPLA